MDSKFFEFPLLRFSYYVGKRHSNSLTRISNKVCPLVKSSRHVLAVAPNVAAMVNLFLNPLRKLNGLKKKTNL